MALPTITAAEIRYRLSTLTSLDVTDLQLASASFIPATDAVFNKLIASTTTLDADQTALVKAAKIAHTCLAVVSSAPVQLTKTSVIDPKYIPAALKQDLLNRLQKEMDDLLDSAGYSQFTFYVGNASVDDVVNDGDPLFHIHGLV